MGLGNIKTGEAMKTAREIHSLAGEIPNPIVKSIARSIGQVVSRSHMADHSLGASLYVLLAIKQSGFPYKQSLFSKKVS